MPHRVAIIEDDPAFVAPLRKHLRSLGYEVLEFNRPEDWDNMLGLKGASSPELFVLDVHMPHHGRYEQEIGDDIGYSGFFLAREIRKRFRQRPIIFFSSYPRHQLRKMAQQVAKGLGNCICLDKQDSDHAEVASQIDSYFKSGKLRRSILERIRESFIARPSFAGFGIDLTKL
jgi:CheY-like chemotaxis protein